MTTTPKQSETRVTTTHANQTPAERFTEMVIREFTSGTGSGVQLSTFQKRLVQNYFISIDNSLRLAEEKRLKKSESMRDPLTIKWENVNMNQLAVNVVACARIGYDPALPNHINMMPFKNNTTKKYDIVFIEGYRGKELKAMKYGYSIPDDVVVEVVYSTDVFRVIKKDLNNKVESYIFEVKDPFDRGDIVGGFYYHVYNNQPSKNKLMFYNIQEIEKRKPEYASAEFWGGEKDKWENGQKVGKIKVDGWYHEMVWKTVFRAAYNDIAIDSQKIDDAYISLIEQDSKIEQTSNEVVVATKANKETVQFEEAEVIPETNHGNQPMTTEKAFTEEATQTEAKPGF